MYHNCYNTKINSGMTQAADFYVKFNFKIKFRSEVTWINPVLTVCMAESLVDITTDNPVLSIHKFYGPLWYMGKILKK